MTALYTALEKRIAEAKAEQISARAKGDFDGENWASDLVTELQSLIDRTATTIETIGLDKDDAGHIADFIEDNEAAFVDFLVTRRVSLAGRHSRNLMNQLRDYKG